MNDNSILVDFEINKGGLDAFLDGFDTLGSILGIGDAMMWYKKSYSEFCHEVVEER